jgi:hypothetical protein
MYSTEAGLHVPIFIFHLQTRAHTLSVRQLFEEIWYTSLHVFTIFSPEESPLKRAIDNMGMLWLMSAMD